MGVLKYDIRKTATADFVSAVVVFLVYEKISGKKLDYKYSLALYFLFVLAINVLATVVCRKVFHIATSSEVLDDSPLYAVKYVTVAVVLGAMGAFVSGWLMKNVKISFVVKKEKRKRAKTKKRS